MSARRRTQELARRALSLSPNALACRLLIFATMIVTHAPAVTAVPTRVGGAEPGPGRDVAFQSELDRAETGPVAVPAERTELTSSQAYETLKTAWTERFGSPPTEETLAILTAQWSHETAEGKAMFNYNFAGIKGVGPSGLHVTQRTREGFGQGERVIRDSFRAYETAKDGALDYLSLLDRKYAGALDAAKAGDVAGFVDGLHKGGYFTGDKRAYERNVSRLADQVLARLDTFSGQEVATLRRLERPAAGATQPARFEGALGAPSHRHIRTDEGGVAALSGESLGGSTSLPAELTVQSFTDHLALAALRIASATDPVRG